jgi:hypothetical protein
LYFRGRFALACGLASTLAVTSCSGPSLEVLERPSTGYLERQGRALSLDGKPYRSLSFVAFQLTGCTPGVFDAASIDAFFASLRTRSLVRTYAFAPLGVDSVDVVVAAAKKYGHLLVLVLTDHASGCGEGGADKTTAWYQSGFRDSFLPWVNTIVPRYRDEPTVGMWEVVKSPKDVDAATLRTFYDVVGGAIHQLDAHHLVEAGTHGSWAYGGAEGYRQIAASAGIDVASFQEYAGEATAPQNLEETQSGLSTIDKPLMLAETGIFSNKNGDPSVTGLDAPCLSWTARKTAFESQLTRSMQAGVVAAAIWTYTPTTDGTCQYSVSPGDPVQDLVKQFPL